MIETLISGTWYIRTDPHGRLVEMNVSQLHNKIESLYKEIKSDKILIKAQAEIINSI